MVGVGVWVGVAVAVRVGVRVLISDLALLRQGQGLIMRGMHVLNVGRKGTLVPLTLPNTPGAYP